MSRCFVAIIHVVVSCVHAFPRPAAERLGRQRCVSLLQELPGCFPKWMCHLHSHRQPVRVSIYLEPYYYFLSFAVLILAPRASRCGFDSCFPGNYRCLEFFHMLVDQLRIFFGEMSIWIFGPFLNIKLCLFRHSDATVRENTEIPQTLYSVALVVSSLETRVQFTTRTVTLRQPSCVRDPRCGFFAATPTSLPLLPPLIP